MFVRRIPARGRRPSSARRSTSDPPDRAGTSQLHDGDWFADAKRNAPLLHVAEQLGMKHRRGRSLSPCPACDAGARGARDLRGPVSLNPDGIRWRCFACEAGGSVVDLVSCHLSGHPLDPHDADLRDIVRDWFAARGYCAEGRHGA